jgi:hypothetical protein
MNCASYNATAAHQCRDRRAEPVLEKATGNFCEYFELGRHLYAAKSVINARESSARDQLKKLFGD